jgi:YD repeat-containing protein
MKLRTLFVAAVTCPLSAEGVAQASSSLRSLLVGAAVTGSRATVAKLKEVGTEVRYIEMQGGGHGDVVAASFTGMIDFCDAHKKAPNSSRMEFRLHVGQQACARLFAIGARASALAYQIRSSWRNLGAYFTICAAIGGWNAFAAELAPPQSDAARLIFEVTDSAVVNPATSGRWNFAGKTLEVHFTGRIAPHENTVWSFFGAGVESLAGRFAHVVLPDGWRHELSYDEKARTVVMRNLRPNRAPAFPGVEGFGKFTLGGRGGRVIEVTNLNDSGPGSLRAAVMATGARTVVFRVSGTIALESELKIREPFLTIAGQTAPGDGICVKNYQVNFDTHDMIIRYVRFRPGDEKGKEQDGFGGGGDHIVIDHCSASWGVDETFSINKASNLTVQWCMVTESLYHSLHKKGNHGYGGLWGGPGGSFHHNILAHHTSRNPRASGNKDSGLLDYRNNVVYNWGFNSAYGGELWPRNWINNYYKAGPATDEKVRHRIFLQKDPRGKMFAAGNYVHGFPKISADNWQGGIDFAPDGEATEATLRVREAYVVAPVTTQTAEAAFERVLAQAGCSLARDSVDQRIVEEIRTGTAKFGASYKGGGKGIIDSQRDVGGWPELRSLPAPIDSDHDGMPDTWEKSHGLNPNDAADGERIAGADGYTHLELYLNSLVPSR